jgi:hypothetical protein
MWFARVRTPTHNTHTRAQEHTQVHGDERMPTHSTLNAAEGKFASETEREK